MYGRVPVLNLRASVDRARRTPPRPRLLIAGVLGIAVAFGVGGALLLRAPSGVKAHPADTFGQKPRARSSPARVSPKLRVNARTPSEQALATPAGTRRIVSGSARARAGDAISRATVCALRAAATRREPDECVSTDTAGGFRLEIGIDATDVAASAAGYLPVRHALPVDAGDIALDLVLSEGSAELSGTVMDASGGTIAGAVVSTRSVPVADEPSEAWVLTDESGTFRLGASSGWHQVTASAVAYSSAQLLLNAPYVGAQFVLAPAAGISGRVVVEGSDRPAPSVTVSAWRSEPESEAAVTVLSDEEGRFRFERLSGGRYRLEAFSSELRALERSVSVGVGQVSSDVVLTARRASSIEGDLMLSAGECESAYLYLDGPMQRVETFDRLGHVRVEGLFLGTYQLAIDCPSLGQRLEETLELGMTPATRTWQLGGGLAITGRVTRPNGSAIRGVGIDVQPMGERAGRHAATCTPDASGVFECGGLQPGEYSVRAVLGETTASEIVKVRIGDRSPEPIVLHTAGSATIRAFVEPLHAAASLERVSRTRGRLVPVAHGDGGLRHYAQARDDHYVFDELPLGGYVVQLGASPGPSPSFRSVQLERDGQVVDVELQREPAADLVGQVVDARNEPVPDAWVEIVGTEPDWLISSADVPPVLSDGSGAFSIVELRAGRYALRATHPSGSARADGASPGGPPVRLRLSDPKTQSADGESAALPN